MYKEIGSNFWLDSKAIGKRDDVKIEALNKILNHSEDTVYLASGRSCIDYLLKHISADSKIALLPSYTCHTVIEPFILNGFKVFYYNIESDFTINLKEFAKIVNLINPTLVLFHSYFGFDTLSNIRAYVGNELKNLGITIIEDLTHSLFSDIEHLDADFYLGSLRKWFAIPDGGFVSSKKIFFTEKIQLEKSELVEKKLMAFDLKREYMEQNIGDKNVFLGKLRQAEDEIDNIDGYYKMSETSAKILYHADYDKLRNKRIDNFNLLLKNIECLPYITSVFKELPSGITPLYFPIGTPYRNELQNHLAKSNIYAPVIWPKYEKVNCNECTEQLYNEILCIPCDQRYGQEEMEYIIKTISDFVRDKNGTC